MNAPSAQLDTLLAHSEWVRALARRLVDDPARADDVAQQTMLEALERPPRNWSSPRGWLASVARNVARGFARSDARRVRREEAVARPEHVDDAVAVVERARLQRELVEHVLALDEPYRSAVLLRYFDGLPPREISKRLGRPVETVRTQVTRGLARLRERLDDEYGGDRMAWCVAFVPLLRGKAAVGTAAAAGSLLTLGGLVMTLKWTIPAVMAALVWTVVANLEDGAAPIAPVDVSGALPTGVQVAPDTDPAPTEPREPVGTADPRPEPPAAPLFDARIVDLGGRPLAGVVVEAELPPGLGVDRPLAVSDQDGHVRLEGPVDATRLRFDRGWIVYGAGRVADYDGTVVIIGPSIRLGGRVVDRGGTAIESAKLWVRYRLEALPGFAVGLEATSRSTYSIEAVTDANGAFALAPVPAVAGLDLEVVHDAHVRAERRVPESDDLGMRIELRERSDADRTFVGGVVVLPGGEPAAKARVHFGQDDATTDDFGRFEFEVTYLHDEAKLLAYLPGRQPAIIDDLAARLREDRRSGRELRVVLGDEALEIRGHVLDARGMPIAGMNVLLIDGTPLGTTVSTLEDRVSGMAPLTTRHDGGFVVRGLSEQTYRVRVYDTQRMLVIDSEAVPAGATDVVLREPKDSFVDAIEGIVVDRAGVPIADLPVRVAVTIFEGNGVSSWHDRDEVVTTGADGRFVVRDCPRRHAFLRIGDGELCKRARVDIRPDGEPLRIEVSRRYRIRLRPAAPIGAADRFEIHDAAGRSMQFVLESPASSTAYRRAPLEDAARGDLCVIDEGAAEIVLFQGRREVRRVPFTPQVGAVQIVAF